MWKPRMNQSQQMQAQQKEARESRSEAFRIPTSELVTNAAAITAALDAAIVPYRTFAVTHTTCYMYSAPVEHSTHIFKLRPGDDAIQKVVRSDIVISSDGEIIHYDDVFGNQAVHCVIDKPYTTLSVESYSLVRLYPQMPDDHSLSRRQARIPLVWMPWQQQMLTPYLLPQELPESQLLSLTEYATSFVERNDSHLLQTIEDVNLSIYRDFKYVPDSTGLNTTPFDVFTSRQGVCQDFANLFICLMRLLNIPARYRMGYIFTGANYANKVQSEASHAWAEVYLPFVGWRGFDPTNGCRIGQDHVRVACGRNFRDTSPTSGTIYEGGGVETLTTEVRVREATGECLGPMAMGPYTGAGDLRTPEMHSQRYR